MAKGISLRSPPSVNNSRQLLLILNMVSRRIFLQRAGVIAGGTALFELPSFGEVAAPNFLSFDLHCHPGQFFAKGLEGYSVDAGIAKTLGEMKTGNLSGAFFALVADAQTIKIGPEGVKPYRNFGANEAWTDYKRQMSALKEIAAHNNSVSISTKGEALQKNFSAGKISAYISCEGGDFLEGDAGKLEPMYEDGVRCLQLVHYHPNEIGDLQTESPQHNGLSAAGKEVVKRMNKLGMVIDLAHASFETTEAVSEVTSQPIILSHSLLKNESTHPVARRMISNEHAKVVAKTGGVIGAWPSGLNKSLDDFIDNIRKLIDVAGIDHVGLGTDMDANFKPVLSSYLQIPQLIDGLKSKGLTEEEVRKVAGANAKRVLEKVI
jgi:membrane dipeptidase